MSDKKLLENIKKLRELTGVGFKDCKVALDETKGDIDKSIEFLRKKGIAKASKKMSRTASEGLALVKEDQGQVSLIEVNSETDFVAKNQDFINFCKELSEINFSVKSNINKLNETKMKNGIMVKDNLVNLIAKIGEKITIRRANFFDNTNDKNETIGSKIAMHIAATNPLAINQDKIKKEIIDKELEIIKAEITNSGKPPEMVEKISKGKLTKFLNDNSLLNQIWIMDPKLKVSDVLKENSFGQPIKIIEFTRYKVGEGI